MKHESLRGKTLKALGWSFLDSLANRLLGGIIAIVLARSLGPAEFGIMGMLTIVIAIASLVVEGGFTGALIQKKDLTRQDTNTAFYVNVGIGFVVALILHFSAPTIAVFYREPELAGVTSAMSLLFVINGFAAVQTAQMIKNLRFKGLAIVTVVSVAVSGTIAVAMARMGYGVWSLVVQQLARAALATTGLWFVSRWRPALVFSTRAFRELFSYGWRMFASGALAKTFENLYFVVIGRAYGAVELGYYTRADMLQRIPVQSLNQVVGRVTFPVFSSIQDQPQLLRTGMRKALIMLVLINFPLMAGLAITAKPLVVALLTERWLRVVPFLQLLALTGLLYPLHSVNLGLLQATGRSDLYLRISVIKQVLAVANVAVTWHIGIEAMIAGQIVLSFLAYFINAHYTRVTVQYSVWQQVRDVVPYALATAVMAVAAWAIGIVPFASPVVELAAQVFVGVVTYFGICALFRLEAYREVVHELSARLGRGNDNEKD